ncbi:hypothetical protein PUR28_26770 [Streptomyces sp. BE308]|uniref:hypothetical protein n=1 Tax=unclassified Streptomyces TaxID=2593676 RepID=UPI002E777DA1|nr:hypothetical protein [Streptomyces sp. BE308]MEE1794333.1 hypothetical protein [Streptomyces sp. BE308]
MSVPTSAPVPAPPGSSDGPGSPGSVGSPGAPAAREARAALDAFLDALNSRSVPDWAKTLHYPHVRVHDGAVTVWETPEIYIENSTPEVGQLLATGWDHSGWERVELIQTSPDQVHAQVRFARYDSEDEPLGSFESLYVLTRQDGRWGVLARIGFTA